MERLARNKDDSLLQYLCKLRSKKFYKIGLWSTEQQEDWPSQTLTKIKEHFSGPMTQNFWTHNKLACFNLEKLSTLSLLVRLEYHECSTVGEASELALPFGISDRKVFKTQTH